MKNVLSRSVTALICMGALMTSVQTWAHDDEDKVLTRTVDEQPIDKKQKKCEKNCKTNKDSKIQTNNSMQHQHGNASEMSQMDHSKMTNMPSSMKDMDHSNMEMPNKTNK